MPQPVIVSAVRTPLGAFNGSLGSTVAILRDLSLDREIVNVNGGSLALGHPIGASGCRVLVTMIYEMKRRELKTGLASLCLGGGEAVAMMVHR